MNDVLTFWSIVDQHDKHPINGWNLIRNINTNIYSQNVNQSDGSWNLYPFNNWRRYFYTQ